MKFSIRALMALTMFAAVALFLWRLAMPVALFLIFVSPAASLLLLYRKVTNRSNLLYRWALLLPAVCFAYVGTIGPFNMLLGSYTYDHSTSARINELGCWLYYPLRALPIPIRDLLDENYVSDWLCYGFNFAHLDHLNPHQVPSVPTQLYR